MKVKIRNVGDGDIAITVSGTGGDAKQPITFMHVAFHVKPKDAGRIVDDLETAIREAKQRKAAQS